MTTGDGPSVVDDCQVVEEFWKEVLRRMRVVRIYSRREGEPGGWRVRPTATEDEAKDDKGRVHGMVG